MTALAHVVVTGAAGAIGGAIARALRTTYPACDLALVDRDADALARTAAALADGASPTGAIRTHVADLADLDALPALIDAINAHGAIDGLVNCAGVMRVQHVGSHAWRDAERLLAIDLLAPLRLQELVVHGMIERGRGAIVNVASMAGRVPLRGCAYYGAAKAGLAMASEVARADLAAYGVRVVAVYPGPVRSALEQGARDDYGGGGMFAKLAPVGDPDELGRKIVRAISDDEPRVIYPRSYELGWTAPNLSRWIALGYGPSPMH